MNASDGTGLVRMNDAGLPGAMLPTVSDSSMAAAPLTVHAASASTGFSFIFMQPSAHTMRMSPEGDEPGL